jgi:hypothetical protein
MLLTPVCALDDWLVGCLTDKSGGDAMLVRAFASPAAR